MANTLKIPLFAALLATTGLVAGAQAQTTTTTTPNATPAPATTTPPPAVVGAPVVTTPATVAPAAPGATVSTPAPSGPTTTTAPAAVSTTTAPSRTTAAPVAGANSYTEGEARRRIEEKGFGQVSDLKKDDQGIWRGTTTKDGKTMGVALDYQGNVVSQ